MSSLNYEQVTHVVNQDDFGLSAEVLVEQVPGGDAGVVREAALRGRSRLAVEQVPRLQIQRALAVVFRVNFSVILPCMSKHSTCLTHWPSL
jgi:hypothetical protein